jgi:hypothetical protein
MEILRIKKDTLEIKKKHIVTEMKIRNMYNLSSETMLPKKRVE